MEEKASRDFPGGPVVDSALPLLGAQFDPWLGNEDPACSAAKEKRKKE